MMSVEWPVGAPHIMALSPPLPRSVTEKYRDHPLEYMLNLPSKKIGRVGYMTFYAPCADDPSELTLVKLYTVSDTPNMFFCDIFASSLPSVKERFRRECRDQIMRKAIIPCYKGSVFAARFNDPDNFEAESSVLQFAHVVFQYPMFQAVHPSRYVPPECIRSIGARPIEISRHDIDQLHTSTVRDKFDGEYTILVWFPDTCRDAVDTNYAMFDGPVFAITTTRASIMGSARAVCPLDSQCPIILEAEDVSGIYHVFNVLDWPGRKMNSPLSTRMNILQMLDFSSPSIRQKQYFAANDFHNYTEHIAAPHARSTQVSQKSFPDIVDFMLCRQAGCDFPTDGLVFEIGSKVFKWKPQITLDVCIRRQLPLIGCSANKADALGIPETEIFPHGPGYALIPAKYIDPAWRRVNGLKGVKGVVECRVLDNQLSFLKPRPDKTTPNDAATIYNTLDSIRDPISVDELCGRVSVDPGIRSSFYTENQSSAMAYRSFHNDVKRDGVQKAQRMLSKSINVQKGVDILDLGCGRGGDLPKYAYLPIRANKLYMTDADPAGLLFNGNSTFQRFRAVKHLFGRQTSVILRVLDFTKSRWSCIHNTKFHLIVCNFAMHFARDSIHSFLESVARHLYDGGVFTATFLDRDRIGDQSFVQYNDANGECFASIKLSADGMSQTFIHGIGRFSEPVLSMTELGNALSASESLGLQNAYYFDQFDQFENLPDGEKEFSRLFAQVHITKF